MPRVLTVGVVVEPVIDVRSIDEMLFDPVLAMIATPEYWLMATPVGFVPVLGLETTVSVLRFTMDAVPSPLLATTA